MADDALKQLARDALAAFPMCAQFEDVVAVLRASLCDAGLTPRQAERLMLEAAGQHVAESLDTSGEDRGADAAAALKYFAVLQGLVKAASEEASGDDPGGSAEASSFM
jgi:hypothetical protein